MRLGSIEGELVNFTPLLAILRYNCFFYSAYKLPEAAISFQPSYLQPYFNSSLP
jgi:hypothetical protein